jgi:putative membrane protein insertion efficiency factor
LKKLILLFIAFYQKFLTLLSFGSCRYYPTCSQYAKEQFMYNNFFKATYFTITRILRCNQLFLGTFDYPLVKLPKRDISYKKIEVKYWFVPTTKNNYILIKSLGK